MPKDDTGTGLSCKATPLFALHQEWNARMVEFAGYDMPVQYSSGIIKEHLHTRHEAGLFDISHMGQMTVSGENVAESLEKLVPGDLSGLAQNRQCYTAFTNNAGGIIDDCMVTNCGDRFFIVANASRKAKVVEHLISNMANCRVELLEDLALLALQGPLSARVLERKTSSVGRLPFLGSAAFSFDEIECWVSRCGYTGEDGYELSVSSDQAAALARKLVSEPEVQPVGFGARDSLRLEAGLCLYGQDIDEQTSPVEAGLAWIVSKKYTSENPKRSLFPGAEKILDEIKNGVPRKRVGLKPQGRTPIRSGAELLNQAGDVIGKVTSGGYGPSVQGPIAMGYVSDNWCHTGTLLNAQARGRLYPVEIVNLPFVAHRYYQQ